MNFNNLGIEGYSAFILGIIFSVASIAGFIYFGRHKDMGRFTSVLITLILPALAILAWTYLIMYIFGYNLTITLAVAFGCAVGYALVAFCLGLIINACVKPRKKKQEEKAIEQPVEETEIKLLAAPEEAVEIAEVEEIFEPVVDEEIVEEQPVEIIEEEVETVEDTAEEVENDEPTEQGVVFSNEPRKTFEEQLNALDEQIRAYYNEVLEYAMSKENTKCSHAKYHTTVKLGTMKLLDSKFSKGTLVCSFMAGSSELKNYSKKEKTVKIKEKPVVIEIDSEESVEVAKNVIDIAFKNISEAHSERIEERKAKRRKPKQVEEVTETADDTEENEFTSVEFETEENEE